MSEPRWYRQPGLSCEFCGGRGHLISVARPLTLTPVAEADDVTFSCEEHIACPEHRFLIQKRVERLMDEGRFARAHGRPLLGELTAPEQMRRDMTVILEKLDAAGLDTAELRAKYQARFGKIE